MSTKFTTALITAEAMKDMDQDTMMTDLELVQEKQAIITDAALRAIRAPAHVPARQLKDTLVIHSLLVILVQGLLHQHQHHLIIHLKVFQRIIVFLVPFLLIRERCLFGK